MHQNWLTRREQIAWISSSQIKEKDFFKHGSPSTLTTISLDIPAHHVGDPCARFCRP
jgi:hypothetical protein